MSSEKQNLRHFDDIEDLLTLSETKPVMLLKHSTRCPVSTFAYREFEQYAADAPSRGIVCAIVLVVEERPFSLELADVLHVVHQSPQAILVKDRKAVWNDSHEGVTREALTKAETIGG